MPSADEIERARVAIYASFATTGRAPSVPELARAVNLDASQTRSALTALHSSRDIVLSPAALSTLSADPNSATHDTDGALIVMAHPFASIPLGFSVMGTDTPLVGRVRVGRVRSSVSRTMPSSRSGRNEVSWV